MKNPMTYISLFSSAGVGCYGFKMEGFECIATNELIERRLNIQKANKKCKYSSGFLQNSQFTTQPAYCIMNPYGVIEYRIYTV